MKIKVITLCSGYDSQCMALDVLMEQHSDFDYELVAWSEFDPESKQPIDKQPAVVAHNALYPQWADDLQKDKKYNAYPHTQPYRDTERVNEIPQWQKDLARWCNRKELIKTTTFENYEPRKGFKCKEYIQQYRYEARRSISDTAR